MALDKHARIMEAALGLFLRDGFHATSIDMIAAAAGVAKMTIYAHFGSKEGLIVASLRWHCGRWREWFFGAAGEAARYPLKEICAVFDVLAEWLDSEEFAGDLCTRALAEYPDRGHPVHRVAAEHKKAVREYFLELARKARLKEAPALAEQWSVLFEGALVLGHARGNGSPARAARQAARTLAVSAGAIAGCE